MINPGEILILAEEFLKISKKKKSEKKPWSDKPEGWDAKSVKKYRKSLTGDSEHTFSECMEKMKDKKEIDNPKAFCGSLKHFGKKKKDKKSDKKED